MPGTLLVLVVSGVVCEPPFAIECSYSVHNDEVHPSGYRMVCTHLGRRNKLVRSVTGPSSQASHTVSLGVPNPCANQPLLQGRPGNEILAPAPRAEFDNGRLDDKLTHPGFLAGGVHDTELLGVGRRYHATPQAQGSETRLPNRTGSPSGEPRRPRWINIIDHFLTCHSVFDPACHAITVAPCLTGERKRKKTTFSLACVSSLPEAMGSVDMLRTRRWRQ